MKVYTITVSFKNGRDTGPVRVFSTKEVALDYTKNFRDENGDVICNVRSISQYEHDVLDSFDGKKDQKLFINNWSEVSNKKDV